MFGFAGLLLAWAKTRSLQIISGAPGWAIAAVFAIIITVLGAVWLKDTIADAAAATRDALWTRQVAAVVGEVRKANKARQAAIVKAASEERAKLKDNLETSMPQRVRTSFS